VQLKRTTAVIAGISCLALALAGCGSKKSSDGASSSAGGTTAASAGGTTTSAAAQAAAYLACMVTDTGGINDKSFNQSAWAGMQNAQKAGKATVSYLPSTTASDYTKNIAALEAKKCSMIVTVGFNLATATTNAAKAKPTQHFAIVDNTGNKKNVQGLLFNTAQAGFQAGYLAAGYSKSGKVATYGGLKFATVTVYMDGFWEGVQYYNKQKSKKVQVLGWSEKTQNGSFAGSFTDQTKGQQLAKNFMQQGADVIYPVAGGTGLGTAAAVKASNGKASVIWVDTDGCVSAPQYCSVFLTTTFKGIAVAVQKVVTDGAAGKYATADYVGTLANGGTGLSPYHDFASKVPAALKTEVAQIASNIKSGKIKLTSKSQP
jgi:basic membrane protein A and related proteins